MEKITRMIKGLGPEGTIWEAEYANKLVDVANAVIGMEIKEGEDGPRVAVTQEKVTIVMPPKRLFFGVANGFPACWDIFAKDVAVPAT